MKETLRIIALSSVLTTAAWATADEGSIGLVNPSGPTEVAPGQNFGFTVNVVMGEGDKSIDTSSIVVELMQYGEVVAVSSTTEWTWFVTVDGKQATIIGTIDIPLVTGPYTLRGNRSRNRSHPGT